MKLEFYTVPKEPIIAIVQMINNRPYGEVAPLAQALGQVIFEQDNAAGEPAEKVE